MTTLPETQWVDPVIPRDLEKLPDELPRGAEVPDDLDPLAEGVLMRHQADWIADDSDLKLGEKGRRTGITFAEALDATLIAAAGTSAGGANYFYIGDTKDKGREFIGYVAKFTKTVAKELASIEEFLFEDQQPDGTTKNIAAYRVRFASGYRVEALSSRPENIRGLQGTVCIDEAAFHRDVRGVLDAVNALLIWGGKIRVISTHNGVLNPFNELIKEARAGRWATVVLFHDGHALCRCLCRSGVSAGAGNGEIDRLSGQAAALATPGVARRTSGSTEPGRRRWSACHRRGGCC